MAKKLTVAEKRKDLRILYSLTTLFALAIALPAYIQSSFISIFVPVKNVGWFYVLAMATTVVAINFYPGWIKKYSNYRTAVALFIVYPLSIIAFITAPWPWWALLSFIIMIISSQLLTINMDLFVERFTGNAVTGWVRTIYFTLINLAWMISALLISGAVGQNDYWIIYALAVLMTLPPLAVFLLQRHRFQEHIKYNHHPTLRTLKNIWRNKNLSNIFVVAFLLQLFYSIAVIYFPIYLHQTLGFSWSVLGLVFVVMILPFILLEIPAGILADKYWGEKEIMVFGFIILVLSVLAITFCHSPSIVFWGALLFASRCGAALVEAMRETYFFKKVDVEQVDYINFFRNTTPLGYLAGALLGVIILSCWSLPVLFFILGIILISGIYFAARLEDTK